MKNWLAIAKRINVTFLSVLLFLIIIGFFVSIIVITFSLIPIKVVLFNYLNLILMFVISFIIDHILDKYVEPPVV
jgi:hypothetical protein